MHGCHHVMTDNGGKSLVAKRITSESIGKSLEEQLALLVSGKEELYQNGIDTDIFIPPGHLYDINTINALRTVGFRYVSDGLSFQTLYIKRNSLYSGRFFL